MNSTTASAQSTLQTSTNLPPCATADDTPLLRFSPMPGDVWTSGDANEGCIVFGRSGGGKSSGAGAAIARALLRQGRGGIVLIGSSDETDNWLRYAQETGRSNDIIRFDGSGRYRFNFLEYEMQRSNVPTDVLISNVVAMLQSVIETVTRATGLSAKASGDAFWEKSTRLLLTQAIDLLYAATGRVRLPEVLEFINTAPKNPDQLNDPNWQKYFFAKTVEKLKTSQIPYPLDREERQRLLNYWLVSFPQMDDRTRSNMITTLETDFNMLQRGQMRKLFCTATNLVPEMTFDGKVVLLDFPVAGDWNETGVMAQMIFKYAWMRSVNRRDKNAPMRPVMNFSDEGQIFLSSFDAVFQGLCRKNKCATVLLTQNLPTFYSRIGGDDPENTVKSMLGNLKTKIFHNNDCTTTNDWATQIIGKETVWRASFDQNTGWNESINEGWNEGQNDGWSDGANYSKQMGVNSGSSRSAGYSVSEGSQDSSNFSYGTSMGDNMGHSSGTSTSISGGTSRGSSGGSSYGESGGRSAGLREERDYAVEPHEFSTQLKMGGKANKGIVTGVVVLPGRYFERNGKHWMQVAFKQ
ncbi:hypothetical protein K1718_27345 (plasmid) [Roseibium porphyridii]|uniref:TraD/TraG TraM recognition site domain-containing protein n=1 Tax=Roseibium porphyridii TaxID=2866279 RepID=A0ABY8FD25_9HYPH|nr:hypothetical protein [Roseibium sp. KMA01]WFE92644.1 hypothetical protein K1718_27345 [Roseibium sp. KMA01]